MRESAYRITATITAVLVAAGVGCASSSQDISSTTSARGTYTVTISQERAFPGYERQVYLNAARAGAPLVRRKLLYTGDMLDDDFTRLYPASSWASESVLRIGQAGGAVDDTLRVSNTTTRRLVYLLIETYRDKFVLLDVEPHAMVTLRFNYDGRLSAEGEALDSAVRFADAVVFADGKETVDGAQFSIVVREDAVAIEGPGQLQHVSCCAADRPAVVLD